MDQSRLDTLEQDWRPILAAVAKVLEQPQAFVKEDHNVAMARVKAVSGFGERCGLPVCLNLIKADQQMVLCARCAGAHSSVHKAECKLMNFVVSVDMWPNIIQGCRPCRIMSCPATATLEQFRKAFEKAFFLPFNDEYTVDLEEWPVHFLGYPKIIARTVSLGLDLSTVLCRPVDKQLNPVCERVIRYSLKIAPGKYLRFVVLLLSREARTSQFSTLWSGASRAVELLPTQHREIKLALRLSYATRELTEENKTLIFWHEESDVHDPRDIKTINESLMQNCYP